MKLPDAVDRRLLAQLALLALLAGLPVAMILLNGTEAVWAILAPDPTEAVPPRVAARHAVEPGARTPLLFGVHDPHGAFLDDKTLRLRHVYVSWAAFGRDALAAELAKLEEAGFEIMLTIEPWPAAGAPRPLLAGVLAGDHDPVIDDLAAALNRLEGPVYLSWGHEMDQDLTVRYPWSNAEPSQFVAAYRHVVDRLRSRMTTQARWIWAGVLKEGSARYWPGADYVDYIGMPIYSFPAWDQARHGHIRDFRTVFEEKSRIVAHLEKPLLITEFGVSGSPDFDAFWMHQAFMAFPEYPGLAGVIFFHAEDTAGAWPEEYGTPDWRAHPDSVRGLVSWALR